MEKVALFKDFVKKNPMLLKYIKNNEMTWQKFYEIYDMYGEEESAWKDYLSVKETAAVAATSGFALGDLLSWLKNINLDSLQEGMQSLQRVVGVMGDVSNKKNNNNNVDPEYKPRPLYKHFDD